MTEFFTQHHSFELKDKLLLMPGTSLENVLLPDARLPSLLAWRILSLFSLVQNTSGGGSPLASHTSLRWQRLQTITNPYSYMLGTGRIVNVNIVIKLEYCYDHIVILDIIFTVNTISVKTTRNTKIVRLKPTV